jgi:hypothetical protein
VLEPGDLARQDRQAVHRDAHHPGWRLALARMARAQRFSPARHPSPGAGGPGGSPQAASTIRVSSSSLPDTCRYSDIGAAPSSAATRPIETAFSLSASATRTAAATTRARLSPGFGPLCGRSRTPHAAATLPGMPAPAAAASAAAASALLAFAPALSRAFRSAAAVLWASAAGTAAELKRRVAAQWLDLTCPDPAAFARLRQGLGGRAVHLDPASLTVGVPTGGGAAEVRDLLDAADPGRDLVASFAVRGATLDDVFFALARHAAKEPAHV